MAGLKVFVSSTCVDLDAYRSQLRSLLIRLGYEPIMSEHSEVLFDPTLHTHASCLKDVEAADMMILLIGSRFGGAAVPEALPMVDLEHARRSSSAAALLDGSMKISITQAEALRAVTLDRPIFTFVDGKVHADHHFYQTNKGNPALGGMRFPSISKPETAFSVFEFVNFMTHRSVNNAAIPFHSFADIEAHLIRQWALLFQRLLHDKREKIADFKKSTEILDKFEELKATILQAMPQGRAKEIARAVSRYSGLASFLHRLQPAGIGGEAATFTGTFAELLARDGVTRVVWDSHSQSPYYAVLLLSDGGFVGCFDVTDDEITDDMSNAWLTFCKLDGDLKEAVLDSAIEAHGDKLVFERHSESLTQYHEKLSTAAKVSLEPAPARRRRALRPST